MPLWWRTICSKSPWHLRRFISPTPIFNVNLSALSFTTSSSRMDGMNGVAVQATKESSTPVPVVPGLTSAILRYQPNGERFQFTFTFKGKKYNFDRAATEKTASFLERIKSNLTKHIKQSEGIRVNIMAASQEQESDQSPVKQILEQCLPGTQTSDLQLEVNDEKIQVRVNPPEVTKIKFLKDAFVGFPILPLKLEGSPNFSVEGSKFIWEYRRVDPTKKQQPTSKKNQNHRRKSISSDNWSPCGNNPNKICYTPDESLNDCILRLTIVPISVDGVEFGLPYSEEGPRVTGSSVKNYLFQERLSRMDPKSNHPGFFRVISYNALADLACTPEWFWTSPKESLVLDYRLPLLNKELSAYQADLMCLQEIDQKLFETNFELFLSQEHGYKGIFSCKVGESREGLATFYNPSKFRLVETSKTVVNDYMQTLPLFKTIAHLEEIVGRISERNTVLQVSVFEFVDLPNTILILANTHLYFKPDADHIRTIQAITCTSFLVAKQEEYKLKYPNARISVMFCGDFNCCPAYGSYRLLTGGKICEDDEDWTQHETEKLIPGPAFEHQLKFATSHPNHELTSIVTKFDGCIDHIFYQSSNQELVKSYPPPSKPALAALFGIPETDVTLPNFQAPSDHLPLISDFRISV